MKALLFAFALATVPLAAQQSAPSLANAQLKDPAQEARALELMEQLRCIQCQGQSIHDSDAPIAAAMRHEVRTQIAAGKSDAEIESWLIGRYGDWVSFVPPASGAGLLLWAMPVLLLAIALLVARGRFRKAAK